MNKEQITSLVRYAAMLIVFVAGLFGVSLSEETASAIAIGVALVALVVYGFWKNQNVTAAAALAQRVLDALKEELLTPEQVERLLEDIEQDQPEEMPEGK